MAPKALLVIKEPLEAPMTYDALHRVRAMTVILTRFRRGEDTL